MIAIDNSCWLCKQVLAGDIYTSDPCACLSYCKACAMKISTGGICKLCKVLFVGMRNRAGTGARPDKRDDADIASEQA